MDCVNQRVRKLRHLIFESDVVPSAHQRERLQQPFDMWVIRVLTGHRETSRNFGVKLGECTRRAAQQTQLTLKMR